MLEDKTEASIRISPSRLIVGGALMLAAAARNHQSVMDGKRLIMPFVRKRFRVLVVWYDRLARTNSIGEIRPWASIVISAPAQPNWVIEMIAARNSPM